jgi:hypothetical protein
MGFARPKPVFLEHIGQLLWGGVFYFRIFKLYDIVMSVIF